MKRFLIFTLILLLVAVGFFYLGYEPSISQVDVSGSLFGYNVQTSKYTLVGLLISLFVFISSFLRFVMGIQNSYRAILNFFVGKNKDKATENLLSAYAHIIAKRHKSAQNYIKKAKKYFKETPHTAIIDLMIEQAENAIRPTSKPLAIVENDKILTSIAAYIEAQYPISKQDDGRMVELLSKAQTYTESAPDLCAYLQILIRSEKFDQAETVLKSARNLLSEQDYKFHMGAINTLKSADAYRAKQPDQTLAYALEAIKHDKNSSMALYLAIQAYKTLQRDNKAIRLFNDYFSNNADLAYVKLFFDLKGIEDTQEIQKRIASLPKSSEGSEAYFALKAYYLAMSRDFISLNQLIQKSEKYHESLWLKATKLCVVVEKDILLSTEAVKIFKETLSVAFYQQVQSSYAVDHAKVYFDVLINTGILVEITSKEIMAKLSLFKDMLKAVPIMHQKTSSLVDDISDQPDLYQLEANIYPKSK